MIIRCSASDRALECGGSLVKPEAEYNPNTAVASEGTACHECMPLVVTGEGPTIDEVASKHGMDADDLRYLVGRARKLWEKISQRFPYPECEQQYSAEISDDIILKGTTDLVSLSTDDLVFLDWKFGYSATEHPGQVTSYCCLGRRKFGVPKTGYITGIEVWVRFDEIRILRLSDDDMSRHEQQLIGQSKHPGQFGPSKTSCQYCPRQNSCAAYDDWVRSGVEALVPIVGNNAITRNDIAAMYDKSKAVGSALRQYKNILESMLADGPMKLPDGRTLVIEEKQKDKILPSKAMRIFREEIKLTADEANEALSISKSGIQKVMKARAPKGKAAAYMRDAMSRLKEVGALVKKTSIGISEKKAGSND